MTSRQRVAVDIKTTYAFVSDCPIETPPAYLFSCSYFVFRFRNLALSLVDGLGVSCIIIRSSGIKYN